MDVPEPMYIAERLSVWFSKRKCHKKSRKIKSIKRRFIKTYGKEAEVFFEMCFTPPKCRYKSAFSVVTEQTYNLVSDILTGLTVDGNGGMANYGGTTDMVVAPVISGKKYTIKTDDSSNFVGAFYYSIPTASTTASYDNQRIVSDPKTFTAPITGYVAFRTSNGYSEAQIVEGETDKPYIKPLSTVDIIIRKDVEDLTADDETYTPITGASSPLIADDWGGEAAQRCQMERCALK